MKIFWNKENDVDETPSRIIKELWGLPAGKWEIVIRKPKLTQKQHNSLWLLMENLANALNEKHQYFSKDFVKKFYKDDFEMMWCKNLVKQNIVNPVMQVFGIKSMKDMTTAIASKIEEAIIDNFAGKGIILTPPSQEAKDKNLKDYEII